ncbi:SMI1/KNR4 family protein [Streptantibioticus rubrisoli]|uniref:SMI1/KNR4 family protein n=1 Tax=Streptantibioticus rubrisoli TaxID=1387313 RepID=A0ABT1P5M5_9ACTN|nr:SMI1/KNR4 family protein [Streptantibioticus rubrisoli]MCQ4040655.1 SMI1/KNR4 family protein [Streptantibioticus rubrisoli]
MEDPSRHDELLARVAARAKERCAPLRPPVTDDELAAAQETLGFPLHPLLSRLYREVADGGFGPEYGLFRLSASDGGQPSETAGPLTAAYLDRRAPDRSDAGWFWPEGVVPIMTYGCGMLACVDCRSPWGAVLLFEPNAAEDDWAHAWFVDSPNLADWLEASLDGTGWYSDPDADDDWAAADPAAEPIQPRPWGAQARARGAAAQPGAVRDLRGCVSGSVEEVVITT